MNEQERDTRLQVLTQVSSFYAEMEGYKGPQSLDLITQGISFFLKEIDRLREHGDRVLSMKRKVSEWRCTVRPIAVSRRRYFERAVTQYLGENEFRKGLDAKERRAIAESHHSELEDESNSWTEVEKALSDLYVDLTDKYKSLVDTKHDIRANLMSLRLQLVLERSGSDLKDLLTEANLKRAAQRVYEQQQVTSPGELGGPDEPTLALDPKDLDNLLGGNVD